MRDLLHRLHSPIFLLALVAAAPGAFAQFQPQEGYPPAYDEPEGPQLFDLTAFAGYQLNGDASTNGGTLEISDAPVFGAALDYRLHRYASLELMWEYNNPDAIFRSNNPLLYPNSGSFSVPSHFFQIGGMTVRRSGRVEPFLGMTVGAAMYVPQTINLETGGTRDVGTTWRFAATFMLGTKIWLTPNVGLRLETRMLMPILFTSSSFYSSSAGSGLAATAGIPSLQFAFTGGLCFGK